MTTVTRDDDSPNIYTVTFGWFNLQTSVEESKYEDIHQNALICPGGSSQKINQVRYQKKRQFTYTMFLVHLPYSINKAIIINVFYHPWHQHCIIRVTNMRQNISSGVSKNVFWKSIIKVGCTYAVIFLWYITKKKTKKDSIIVLRNGIHLCHMIYFGISLLIQPYVFYQKLGTSIELYGWWICVKIYYQAYAEISIVNK